MNQKANTTTATTGVITDETEQPFALAQGHQLVGEAPQQQRGEHELDFEIDDACTRHQGNFQLYANAEQDE